MSLLELATYKKITCQLIDWVEVQTRKHLASLHSSCSSNNREQVGVVLESENMLEAQMCKAAYVAPLQLVPYYS